MRKLAYLFGPVALTSTVAIGCATEEHDPPAEPTSQLEEAVINGVADTGGGAHANVVFVFIGGFSSCTGTLVAPNLVLTARHCVSQTISQGIGCDIYGQGTNLPHVGGDYSPSSLTIHTGYNPGSAVAQGVQILHPGGTDLCNNDIAFIRLNTNVGIAPRAIRTSHNAVKGESTTVVGYGQTETGFSGLRNRRSNVPVLSVGQDWNQISSTFEFVMGQSTCQGDSGGPVVASSGAVIGVTSRGGDCISANQHFTALWGHQALIDQAFAAAGASPILEGVAPPNPPQKIATGEGPCTTGSDCVEFLCVQNGGDSYCSNFCPPTCAAGTICDTGFVSLGGDSVEADFCQPLALDTACKICRNDSCEGNNLFCMAETECRGILECADACADTTCAEACNPGTNERYNDLLDCMCAADECGNDCANHCGGPIDGSGGGNAGGSGSGAGSSSGGSGGTSSGSASGGSSGGDGGEDDGCSVTAPGSAPLDSRLPLGFIALAAGVGLARRRRSA